MFLGIRFHLKECAYKDDSGRNTNLRRKFWYFSLSFPKVNHDLNAQGEELQETYTQLQQHFLALILRYHKWRRWAPHQ